MTLLAQFPLFDAMRETLANGPDESELRLFVAGFLGFVLLVLVAARWMNGERRRRTPPPPDHLTTIVDVLGLTEQDRHDLRVIAERARLGQPVAMLLTPRNFVEAVQEANRTGEDVELLARVDDLSQRMFGAPLSRLV